MKLSDFARKHAILTSTASVLLEALTELVAWEQEESRMCYGKPIEECENDGYSPEYVALIKKCTAAIEKATIETEKASPSCATSECEWTEKDKRILGKNLKW